MGGGHRGSWRIDSERELVYVMYIRKSPKEEENKWEPMGTRSKIWETGGKRRMRERVRKETILI